MPESNPSVVAHPELDFPDCLTEFYQGAVYAYQRAIEEFEDGRMRDLPREDTAHLRDAVDLLDERVEYFRKKAEEVQTP